MAKKQKAEKEPGKFAKGMRKISDFFYDISVKLHAKTKGRKPEKEVKGSARKKELIFYFSVVALPLLQYFIFYICVNFNSILLAFKQYKVVGGREFWEYYNTAVFAGIFVLHIQKLLFKRIFQSAFVLAEHNFFGRNRVYV